MNCFHSSSGPFIRCDALDRLQFYKAVMSAFMVHASTLPFFKILAELPIWFPDGNILLLLATFEAVCQPGPLSETNKWSSVYCISFQAALSTLNLAPFQSNQNPISRCANSICFISRQCYAEEAGGIFNLLLRSRVTCCGSLSMFFI